MSDPEDPGGAPSRSVEIDDQQDVPVDTERVRRIAAHALAEMGVPPEALFTVVFVAPDRMAELKEHAFGVREPTDVLAFPIDDPLDPSPGPLVLGDVVICPAQAAAQAPSFGRTTEQEIDLLLVHGILHLLGRDHAEPAAERAMFAEQDRLLEGAAR